jgi:transketolase
VRALASHDGPAYLRLGRAGEPVVHPGPVDLEIGRAIRVRDGSDAAILVTGNMLPVAVAAAALLAESGVACRVVSLPTVKPLDAAAVEAAARETRALVTLEEHYRTGGLGGAVAELLAESGIPARFRRLGAADGFAHVCGDQEHLRALHGLTPPAVAGEIRRLLGEAR